MQIPLYENTILEEEKKAIYDVVESGQMSFGPKCLEFEEVFAKKLNVRNAVFVNSGSSANLLAFFALANPTLSLPSGQRRMTPGSEVIVPAVTWSTTIWPIIQAGAIPVLVDSDPLTLQMKPEAVEKAISAKTVGICAVHVLGNSCDMDRLNDIAATNQLWLMEDTCESLGGKWDGTFLGTTGIAGTYSFFFSHHITTIEGGMIVTPDDDFAELLRSMRAHGWTRHLKNKEKVEAQYSEFDPRFLFINTGFNVRPTEINAAIGLIQIEKLQKFNERRVQIAEHWNKEFFSLIQSGDILPNTSTQKASPVFFGYSAICKNTEIRNRFKNALDDAGIETRHIICGNMARQPAFQHFEHRVSGSLDGADKIMDCGIYWGANPGLSDDQVQYVTKVVKGFFNG
ncbi:MAG: DegT/DnrJ/EryC1/StrS family aminotransferase [Bdellovibrionales bacterium]|nr:DegT/DnrJ/EryC1/StrS family aminotransferase [Bdellovibrionales bacterium]